MGKTDPELAARALLAHEGPDGRMPVHGYDWGPAGTRRANPWVTAQARSVLEAAGRM